MIWTVQASGPLRALACEIGRLLPSRQKQPFFCKCSSSFDVCYYFSNYLIEIRRKSSVWETLNMSTDTNSSTDTIGGVFHFQSIGPLGRCFL